MGGIIAVTICCDVMERCKGVISSTSANSANICITTIIVSFAPKESDHTAIRIANAYSDFNDIVIKAKFPQ